MPLSRPFVSLAVRPPTRNITLSSLCTRHTSMSDSTAHASPATLCSTYPAPLPCHSPNSYLRTGQLARTTTNRSYDPDLEQPTYGCTGDECDNLSGRQTNDAPRPHGALHWPRFTNKPLLAAGSDALEYITTRTGGQVACSRGAVALIGEESALVQALASTREERRG